MRPDPERAPGDETGHGCGESARVGQVLGNGHAADVVLDGPGPGDEQLAGEVVPGDGAELAGQQGLAAV